MCTCRWFTLYVKNVLSIKAMPNQSHFSFYSLSLSSHTYTTKYNIKSGTLIIKMNDETSKATEKTNVSETNLVLAKIVLKTLESGQINITDHLPLFHVFESIAESAQSSTTTSTIRSR
jgi:hypothetical protein